MTKTLGPLVAIAAALGCGSSATTIEPCPLPPSTDDLVAEAVRGSFPGVANKAALVGARLLVCGDGFVALAAPGADPQVTADAELAGQCAGVAALNATRALVATRAGRLALVDVPASAPATIITTLLRPATTYYELAADGAQAWVAAGASGVVNISVSGDALAEEAVVATSDARGVLPLAGALLVADGSRPADDASDGGAETRLLSQSGALLGEVVGLVGISTKLLAFGDRVVALRPGFGFDVLDVDLASATPLTLAYSVAVVTGLPLDAAISGDSLLVAAGSSILRFSLGASSGRLVSTEDRATPGALTAPWFRSVAVAGDLAFAVTDEGIVSIAIGSGAPSPEISITQTTFTLGAEQTEALYRFDNLGEVELIVGQIEADAPFSSEAYEELSVARDGCQGQYVVAPGEGMLAWQRYDGDDSWNEGELRVSSNDADEPTLVALSEINRPLAAIGDTPEDFSLPTVSGDTFRLTEHIGQVVVAKLYNPL